MRTAVFVDAGYIYAQGSVLLTGVKQGRETMSLSIAPLVEVLRTVVVKEAHLPLLRIYWYDAMRQGRLSEQQLALADFRDVKIRLGQINSVGEQKGVDALIVTDLAELARNQAITDAVLVSGDEDVRVGVVLSQQFGVRVHLIGIHPARANQSRSLMQEADTTTVWDLQTVSGFLTHTPTVSANDTAGDDAATILEAQIKALLMTTSQEDLIAIRTQCSADSKVPPEFDRKILKIGRLYFERETLTQNERLILRQMFIKIVGGI